MASTAALGAAAQDRKARLAQLKSLKRKQAETQDEDDYEQAAVTAQLQEETVSEATDITSKYLSGRNYDAETKGAKLGFEVGPAEGRETLEKKAAALAEETKRQAEEEEKADKPLDLFKLQPKKPNWDLKRDLDRKMDLLNVRTDNAIARLVRERISQQQAAAKAKNATNATNGTSDGGDAEAAGIEGTTLVEATNLREREDEEEARRDREEDDALLDGS